MEDGQVSEMGSHQELVAARGAYAALWESWHGGSEPAPAPGGRENTQAVDGAVDIPVESLGAQGINGRCPVDD